MSNIDELRKQKVNKINYIDSRGKTAEFKTACLRLPWIIAKLWSNKLIGELPNIFYDTVTDSEVKPSKEDKKRIPYEIDIADILIECLEAGKVCFIPKYVDEKYFIDIVPESAYEYVESENGTLIHFEYTRSNVKILVEGVPKTVTIKTVYFIDENSNACMYEVYSGEVINTTEPTVIGTVLPPKIVRLHGGSPIWINAAMMIKDANNTYTEMMYDMELSRKLLALPDRFINKGSKNPRDTMLGISDTHRAVRAMPMGTDKDEKAGAPQWFEGNYSPEPFIDTLNFQLHLISLNCYFGSRYLSYDKDSNKITATEVTSTDNDLYINRQSLLKYVEVMYVHTVEVFDMLTGKPERQVIVEHGDSIFDNEDKRNNQLSMDASVGLVNKRKYLMERYGLDEKEVDEWLPMEDTTYE